MAELVNVPRSEWKTFFDHFADALLGKWVEIEVASLDLGDQIIAERIPLFGITYDTRNDLLDVGLDRMNHLIRHPREILVEQGQAGLTSVAVIDGDGARQVIRLKEPLMLTGATAHAGDARRK